MLSRYQHGEFFSGDSIKHTGPAYHTANGREVYGGGGITPDIFVGEDTLDVTSYYKKATMSGLLMMYASDYTDANRQKLSDMKDWKTLETYLRKQNLVEKFVTYADRQGLRRRNLMVQRSHRLLERFLLSRIVYNILNEDAWTQCLNADDPAVARAQKVFREGTSFPSAPSKKKK